MSKARSRQRDVDKERQWREVIRTQQSSGQSVREFCRQAGVKEAAFYRWRRELARRSPTETMVRRGATKKVAGLPSKALLRSKARPQTKALPRATAGTLGEAGRESVGPGRGRLAASKRTRKAGQGRPASRAAAAHDRPSPFLPIHVLAENTAAGVEIHLGDGRIIRVGPGVDRQMLVEVLRALEACPC
jgi:hypothetical protein